MSTPTADHVRHVGEREARQTAEAAREADWRLPSFGKQLFLGDYRLDLIHPHPRTADDAVAAVRSSAPRYRRSAPNPSTARRSSGTRRFPTT
jgi:hypothetical protein